MKKLLATTLLVGAAFVGFSGQADAAGKDQLPFHIDSKVIQYQGNSVEDLNNILKEIAERYNINVEDLNLDQINLDQFQVPKQGQAPAPEQSEQPEQQEQPTVDVPQQEAQPVENRTPQTSAPETSTERTQGLTQDEQRMIDLVNEERQKNGLQPLKANLEITKVARVKAQDMIDNNYFDHNSPTYGSPFDMMRQFGIEFRTAGENLAGNQTVEAAHQALMNSQGHRANILSPNYTEIGVGVVEGGPYGKMFVQMFKG
ncbi:hypothetical protein E2L07_09225 [Halalkalibacterium halodurans]|uniref:CAP domain-containing protein n=1 Tax=Halalkalibacterium halodurans TaxID=86665 RepID=UPI00106768C1|nr:CAP domain-containing protein [Halalkalibacterium halodurans]MED4161620.1 CAP domain-containing protein [Halalkalibacterium halodurans]TES54798.1 hypothetical protein E2L07_09225 [Halalkalibacterium halodurans]